MLKRLGGDALITSSFLMFYYHVKGTLLTFCQPHVYLQTSIFFLSGIVACVLKTCPGKLGIGDTSLAGNHSEEILSHQFGQLVLCQKHTNTQTNKQTYINNNNRGYCRQFANWAGQTMRRPCGHHVGNCSSLTCTPSFRVFDVQMVVARRP